MIEEKQNESPHAIPATVLRWHKPLAHHGMLEGASTLGDIASLTSATSRVAGNKQKRTETNSKRISHEAVTLKRSLMM